MRTCVQTRNLGELERMRDMYTETHTEQLAHWEERLRRTRDQHKKDMYENIGMAEQTESDCRDCVEYVYV